MKLNKEDLVLIIQLIDASDNPDQYAQLRSRVADQLYKLTV